MIPEIVMKLTLSLGRAPAMFAMLWLVACGSSSSPASTTGTDAATVLSGDLLPFQAGNSWTYRVSDDGVVTTKVTTIGPALEPVGGIGPHKDDLAFKVETRKGTDGMDETISWQAQLDDKVVRYREQSFSAKTGDLELEEHWDPYKLHVDESSAHRITGAAWVEAYVETKLPVGEPASSAEQRDPWTVDIALQSVTVPAGTFDAVVLQKAGGSNLKTYWYVPGIGKVKETGGQTEELVSFQLTP
jgi:hypothetical protein